MEVRKTLQAGEHGTKRWQSQFGNKLLIVRYRYDDVQQLRYTTVEIVVEEKPYIHCDTNGFIEKPADNPTSNNTNLDVYIKIDYHELQERQLVKAAGAYWDPEKRLWKLNMTKVKELGFENRVIECSWIWIFVPIYGNLFLVLDIVPIFRNVVYITVMHK